MGSGRCTCVILCKLRRSYLSNIHLTILLGGDVDILVVVLDPGPGLLLQDVVDGPDSTLHKPAPGKRISVGTLTSFDTVLLIHNNNSYVTYSKSRVNVGWNIITPKMVGILSHPKCLLLKMLYKFNSTKTRSQ